MERILSTENINVVGVEFYELFGKIKIPFVLRPYSVPEIYNRFIQQNGNTGITWLISCLIFLVIAKFRKKRLSRSIDNLLAEQKPDLVFSIIPLANGILSKRLEKYSKELRLHTIVVDFCQPFPYVWIQSKRQIIYGWHKKLFSQGLKFGIPSSQIVDLKGQIISLDLSNNVKNKSVKTFVVYVVWGGNGSKRIAEYAHFLEQTDEKIEIHYVVGKNNQLKQQLLKQLKKQNSKVYSFITNIDKIYNRSDLIIGKPGPSVISESIYTNTPLLLEYNKKTLVQERYNAKWAVSVGVALKFKNGLELKEKLIKLASDYVYYQSIKKHTYSFSNNSSSMLKKSILTQLFDGT